MARKPFKGSTIDNVLTHGVGALNIDATRIGWNDTKDKETASKGRATPSYSVGGGNYAPNDENQEHYKQNEQGRFPSNVIGEVEGYQKYFYCPKVSRKERHIGFENPMTNSDMIEALGATLSGDGQTVSIPGLYDIKIHGLKHEYEKIKGKQDPLAHIETLSNYSQGDVKNHPLWDPSIGTNVQRLKHKILEHNKDLSKKEIPTEQSMLDDMGGYYCDSNGNRQENAGKVVKLPHLSGTIQIHGLKEEYRKWCEANNKTVNVGNNHPTVKPVALMRYLIKLVTPANSTVLDPFTGSGSTGMAAVELGHTFIGCELDPKYVAIASRRIEAWNTEEYDNMFKELFE
jgi:hypothetical protein